MQIHISKKHALNLETTETTSSEEPIRTTEEEETTRSTETDKMNASEVRKKVTSSSNILVYLVLQMATLDSSKIYA